MNCSTHTSESDLTRKVKAAIKRKWPKSKVWKFNDRFTSGILDFLILINGAYTWIELKTETGELTKLQEWEIQSIKECGGEAEIARSVREAIQIIERRVTA